MQLQYMGASNIGGPSSSYSVASLSSLPLLAVFSFFHLEALKGINRVGGKSRLSCAADSPKVTSQPTRPELTAFNWLCGSHSEGFFFNAPLLPQRCKLVALRAEELEVSLIVYRNEYTPSVDATAASTHTFNSCGWFFPFFLEAAMWKIGLKLKFFFFLAFLSQHALWLLLNVFFFLYLFLYTHAWTHTYTHTLYVPFYIHSYRLWSYIYSCGPSALSFITGTTMRQEELDWFATLLSYKSWRSKNKLQKM